MTIVSADDRLSFFVFGFFFLSVLSQVSLLLVSWGKLPPQVPLFYSRPWGEDMLAAPSLLFLLPAIAIFCFSANYIISNVFFKTDEFLTKVLLIFTFLTSLITLWGTVKIISLLL